MKRGLVGLYTLLFVFATFIAVPQPSQACSCAKKPSVQEELQRKTAIFAGKVVKLSEPHTGFFSSSADPVTVTFAVSNVWKGEVRAELNVNTPISGSSCGYSFEMNREYLVYASSDGTGKQTTMLCDGTKPLSGSADDLAVLGAGEKPPALTHSFAPVGGIPLFIYVSVVVSFVVALLLCFWGIQIGYGIYLSRKYIRELPDIRKSMDQGELPSEVEFVVKLSREKMGKRIGVGLISIAAAAIIAAIVYALLMSMYTS
ncbi:hypothetical protein OB236_17615 [Paenibacillus sp. WQ 127069]|uniref:Tissue inhibitor of metalloproteinase n=1 Tax=Paenibacillus baimaensis TaxID=2982185 RepID=A0ABT2UH08_9BACL|nr:hypothetical protein [Paenibacillus sp. WQ 127069]MCU6793924.1 hypothetical protein [Paenibacillus sp. WQ 127069]